MNNDRHKEKQAAVLAALKRRSEAVVAADVAHLEAILAPEFRHVHATGRIEQHDAYLATFVPGQSRFTTVEPREVTISVYGEAAIVAGDIYIERQVEQERLGKTSRFAAMWHEADGQWQLVYWQMTAIQG